MLSLERYRVLDLSRALPGPLATHILADMGMEVIRVEEPDPRYGVARDSFSPVNPTPENEEFHAARNIAARNKKSIALNLLDTTIRPVPQEIFYRLAQSADVILEGYRPGATTWMGVDYETIRKHNPKIIYCSMTGYGQDGPYSKRGGHGGQFDGTAGILQRDPDGRPFGSGFPLGDHLGSLYAALSIVSTLLNREFTGEGQYIDVALTSAAMTLGIQNTATLMRGEAVTRPNRPAAGGAAGIGQLLCRDGKWLTTGNSETVFWENFCKVLGHPEWIALRRSQGPEVQRMHRDVQDLFLTKDRAEWLDILSAADTVVAPVNDTADALNDPQMRHVGMAWDMDHPTFGTITQLGFPVRYSSGPVPVATFAPILGQHTRDILAGANYTAAEIEEFERTRAVRSWLEGGWTY